MGAGVLGLGAARKAQWMSSVEVEEVEVLSVGLWWRAM